MSSNEKMIEIRLTVPEFMHNKIKARQKERREQGLPRKTIPEVTREYVLGGMLKEECRKP